MQFPQDQTPKNFFCFQEQTPKVKQVCFIFSLVFLFFLSLDSSAQSNPTTLQNNPDAREEAPSSESTSLPQSLPVEEASSTEVTPKIPQELLPFVPLIDASLTPSTGKLGGVFSYSIEIERPKDVSVSLPDPLPFSPKIKVRTTNKPEIEESSDGMVKELHSYELQIFSLGEGSIPSFVGIFRTPTGESAQVAVPEVSFTIQSQLEEGADINESFSPRDIPPPPPTWTELFWRFLPYGIGVFFFLILGVWALRRRGKIEDEQTVISPLQVALFALDDLEEKKPSAKEFHIKLSEILRAYLEDFLKIPAREASNSEVLARSKKARIETLDLVVLEAFLLENDLAKFAKETPPLPELLQSLHTVRRLIESTASFEEEKGENS